MLKLLRKNTHTIIWSVILVFILWGGFNLSTQFKKQGRYAGEVFGKHVPLQEFDRFYRAVQIFSFGAKKAESPEQIRNLAWQSVVFAREAKRLKVQITDDEVRQEILRLLAAQNMPNPEPEFYKKWVQVTLHETPLEFETQVREILLIRKLIDQLSSSEKTLPPSDSEIKQLLNQEKGMLSLEYVTFPSEKEAADFAAHASTPELWKQESEKNGSAVKKTGLLTLKELALTQNLPEETVMKLYQSNSGEISAPLLAGAQFGIFYLADKKQPDPADLTDELRKQYSEQITNQKKQVVFLNKSFDILQRANLKDYLPKSETESPS